MSDLEIKYAPTKCKHFCLGDCCIDMKTCNSDYPQCDKSEPKEQTNERNN